MPHCTLFDDRMSDRRQFTFFCSNVTQPSWSTKRVNERFYCLSCFFSNIFELASFGLNTKGLSNHSLLWQCLRSKKSHTMRNGNTGSDTMWDIPARTNLMTKDMAQANADIA